MIDFYPRSPRGERRDGPDRPAHIIRISIHAPRVGSDYFNSGLYFICQISIHAPRVGSDGNQIVSLCPCEISIHAPRVGSDPIISTAIKRGFRDFYPRSPRGERLGTLLAQREADGFLSTLPAWGATKFIEKQEETNNISIHAPRVGSDGETVLDFTMGSDFYPHSPRGERQILFVFISLAILISIHAPRVGSDVGAGICIKRRIQHFYPRSPRGERRY